ncbi:hypothetical protein EXU57_16455 [Segetibacter sp. 3557_3]|uniref:PSP1 domain-containing protein n=1 Tax=Segetibacter sp. 3557_3 TaxID=2547429 RepID=UPI0010592003|nr:regulatory iron-sulfur-containing complex subunit RicT [Segetibacter sp. 3557_3]TDH24071.1 hypothetical protein EXU57_16455 [Segetibacter sp. 3557_3]
MACGSCGTSPNGCKSNGGCSSGGCNRMNVHDWLMNLPFSDPESSCKVIEVSFNNGSRKDFYRNPTLQYFEKGELVTVEGVSGFDVGEVTLSGEMVRLQLKKKKVDEFHSDMKKILRRSTDSDITKLRENKAREKEALVRSRAMARQLNLQMKLAEVEIQADGKKATFYYTADDRVDFRELIRSYAGEFKVKVEMRQIGARQEAGKVGGIGSCGRELCCSTWLTDFKSVNTTAARYQNLSINQTKLSGQCGRLKCCLNYELDTYLDALQHFPDNADVIQTAKSPAYLVKKDIFKNLMWYTLPESSKHYPLTITRVKEIQRMNAEGKKPDDLQPVEVVSSKPKEVEPEFVDVVGQTSLRSLEKGRRNDRQPDRKGGENRGGEKRNVDAQPPRGPRQQQPAGKPNQVNQQRSPGGPENRPQRGPDTRPQGGQENRSRPAQQARTGGKPADQAPRNQPQQPANGAPQRPQRPPQNRPPQNRPPQKPTPGPAPAET